MLSCLYEFAVAAIGIRKCLQEKIGKGVFVMANDSYSTILSGKGEVLASLFDC
jgi:hypothetical protein